MNPQEASPTGPHKHVSNDLTATRPGERTIFAVKRHPIGIFGVYTMCGLALIFAAVLAFAVAPSVFSNNSTTQVVLAGTLVFVVVAAISIAFALIATRVYWGNSWILTSDSLTQVNQISLFRRQSSQLAVDDIEDVTAEQNGLLPHMFNYGVLKVETAGEQSKFMFMYCPNPNYYAQKVLAAREAYDQHDLGGQNGSYQQPPAYQPPPPAEAESVPAQSAPVSAPLPSPEPILPTAQIAETPQVPPGRLSDNQ